MLDTSPAVVVGSTAALGLPRAGPLRTNSVMNALLPLALTGSLSSSGSCVLGTLIQSCLASFLK